MSQSNPRALGTCLVALYLSCLGSECVAQPVLSDGVVKFDQTETSAKLIVSVDGVRREPAFDKSKKATLRLDDDGLVGVQVATPNRVLFTYSARDIVATDTADRVAADKLATAIAGLIEGLGGGPTAKSATVGGGRAAARAAPRIRKVVLEEIDLVDLARRVEWVMNTWDSATPTIEALVTPASNDHALETAEEWKRALATSDPSQQLGGLPKLWRKLISPQQRIACRIEYEEGDPIDCSANREDLLDKMRDAGNLQNAQLYIDMALAIETERKNLLAQVADIRDLADAITSNEPVSLATVAYVQDKDQDLTIDVKANPRFESLLGKKAKAYRDTRVGSYSITFSPYELVHMRPNLGVIYSFVKSPKFSTARNAAGDLTIAGKTSEYSEYGGLVAMDFMSDKFVRKGIRPFLQIGVAPSSDSLGVAVGIGVRAYQSFTFSIGAVYQRVDKLGAGLAIGDVIDDEADLETGKEFKAGFYLGVGVKLD